MSEIVSIFIKKALWLLAIVFIARCAISFTEISSGFSLYLLFSFLGEAITITTIIALIYEKKLWVFDKTSKVPVLKGKYFGKIMSNYDGRTREARLEIKQSLLALRITMKSDESKSGSISASISDALGINQVIYCYINQPIATVRDRSEIHYGTAILSCEEGGKLTGSYYTDRMTTGEMVFVKEGKKI